ncbi:WD repeat-containing protein 44-like isoform X1 [Hibiscus syriacus]|uniref:WD repeat-containing protein 44-like isoform X1 n=1 Tax=Hibiscus syriacus TaxID=106335 RepID=UPI001923F027|nr:WD repeat-containing protein 44-like isoform X1 [Hibiscus syriacus]
MMGSVSEEEDQFFDTREDITSVSDFGSDCPENSDSEHAASASSVPANFRVEVWIKNLSSLRERRNKFLKWMGLSGDQTLRESPSNMGCDEIEVETDRIMEESGAVLGSSAFVDGFSSSQSSVSCWSSDVRELLDGAFDDNFLCRIKNLDDGTEFIVDEVSQDGMFKGLREVGSNKLLTIDEFERKLGLSPLVQKAMRWEVKAVSDLGLERKQGRKGWLRRLGAVACIVDRQGDTARMMSGNSYPNGVARIQMVRVRSYKKRSKEFSALYMRQDIQAHEGAILTMKFSPDGQYLASAGEDGVVRVWQVVESESSGNSDIHDVNPSYVYFQVNNFSELVPLHADKEKKEKSKSVKKNSDTICVIFPRKVFRILDKPIHEFHGHCGEVLNLSWSKNKHILSSSIDKTVRLWQVGYDECQKVFFHNNYVTCVQFNPVNDDYFISGSIDGKVRIWAIPGCQVVDWTDVRDIVTAVCYRPDGKGAVIGSMNGNCHFYDASDNCLQLNAQICIHCKKKSPCSRITGLQFSPGDPDILMITSADSQVRILNGIDMVCKFRGLHNAGSQVSAAFTLDGMRIVSASEDSNVYVWNYVKQDGPVPHAKNNWSCERFFSNNASVAIPWCGISCRNSTAPNISGTSPSPKYLSGGWRCNENTGVLQPESGESSQNKLGFSSSERFSLGHGFFSESLPKGTATWPEEKLPFPNSMIVSSSICKSQYKLLKTSCQSALGSSHAWGLVIVTAGYDG